MHLQRDRFSPSAWKKPNKSSLSKPHFPGSYHTTLTVLFLQHLNVSLRANCRETLLRSTHCPWISLNKTARQPQKWRNDSFALRCEQVPAPLPLWGAQWAVRWSQNGFSWLDILSACYFVSVFSLLKKPQIYSCGENKASFKKDCTKYLLALNRAKKRLIRTLWPGYKRQLCLTAVKLTKSPVRSNRRTLSLSCQKVPSHSDVFYNDPPTCLSFCYKWGSQRCRAMHCYRRTGRSWRTAGRAAGCAGGTRRATELCPRSEQQQVERDPALAVEYIPFPLPAETGQTGSGTAGTWWSAWQKTQTAWDKHPEQVHRPGWVM